QLWKAFEEERSDIVGPEQIHDFFMRQNGVCGRATTAHQNSQEKYNHMKDKRAYSLGQETPGDSGELGPCWTALDLFTHGNCFRRAIHQVILEVWKERVCALLHSPILEHCRGLTRIAGWLWV